MTVTVDNRPIRLQLVDTAGAEDFADLRRLCYRDAELIALCYSTAVPSSFASVREKWLPEFRLVGSLARIPILLVGLQADRRDDLGVLRQLERGGEKPLRQQDGERLAKDIGALGYVECSALTQRNLKLVFDTLLVAGLRCKYRQSFGYSAQLESAAVGMRRTDSDSPSSEMSTTRRLSVRSLFCCM